VIHDLLEEVDNGNLQGKHIYMYVYIYIYTASLVCLHWGKYGTLGLLPVQLVLHFLYHDSHFFHHLLDREFDLLQSIGIPDCFGRLSDDGCALLCTFLLHLLF